MSRCLFPHPSSPFHNTRVPRSWIIDYDYSINVITLIARTDWQIILEGPPPRSSNFGRPAIYRGPIGLFAAYVDIIILTSTLLASARICESQSLEEAGVKLCDGTKRRHT